MNSGPEGGDLGTYFSNVFSLQKSHIFDLLFSSPTK